MSAFRYFSLFLFLLPCSLTFADQELEEISQDLHRLTECTNNKDIDCIERLTWKRLVQLSGGSRSFQQTIALSLKTLTVSTTLKSVHPPTITDESVALDVWIIPATLDVKSSSESGLTKTFFLAVREKGTKKWQYISGSGLKKNPHLMQILVDDIENKIQLPEIQILKRL